MKYILFDLDGTLLNTRDGIVISVQRAIASQGIQIDDLILLERHIGPPLKDGFIQFYGFNDEIATAAVKEFRKHYQVEGLPGTKPYDGIKDCLVGLKDMGYQLIVATSKPELVAKKFLRHFQLDQYFLDICGSIDEGEEKRITKGQVLDYVIKNNQIDTMDQTIMVGDRFHDVMGAKEVQIPCIGVSYGFGSREELMNAGAIHVVDTPRELLEYIKCME